MPETEKDPQPGKVEGPTSSATTQPHIPPTNGAQDPSTSGIPLYLATGPDPMDIAAAIVSQDYLEAARSDRLFRPPKIRKPVGGRFFRVFHYWQIFNLYADTVSGKIEKTYYIIMPEMAAAMERYSFRAALILCVTVDQIPFIWPLRARDESRVNAWDETAWDGVNLAQAKWTKLTANQKDGAGYYDVEAAKGDFGEPRFPASDAESYLAVLRTAIPDERKIGNVNHTVFYHKIEGRP